MKSALFISVAVVTLLIGSVTVDCYKILAMFPTITKSQLVYAQPLLVALAEKGHLVTVVSPYGLGKDVMNYRDVVIPIEMEEHSSKERPIRFDFEYNKLSVSELTAAFAKQKMTGNPISTVIRMQKLSLKATNDTINHPTFKKIMKDETFDATIHGYTHNYFQLGLASHFKCPSIVLSSVPIVRTIGDFVGQPSNPEAVPSFVFAIKGKMTFFQRVGNMLVAGIETVFALYQDYLNGIYYESNFPSNEYPPFNEVRKNVSLLLVNDHFSQGNVRPTLPNVIEVSGLQINSRPSPLPDDIKTWVDDAKDGLILVSFGANIKSKDLDMDKRQTLLNSFAKLKQRVLWKFEDNSLTDLPKNVMIKKWLPQNDVLAHANTKIFVSHMGIGSYNEAMYHAVPVIAIPFTGDQNSNARKAKGQGWAEILPISKLTEVRLAKAVNKLLNNSNYLKAVKKLSNLYRDKPLSAIDTAVYWIEYVIRQKGAKHMQYPGVELNFFQRNSLDVFGFLLGILYVLKTLLVFLFRKLKAFCLSKKIISKNRIKKKKKQ